MNPKRFRSALGDFLLRWRAGLLLAGVLRAVGWVGLALLLSGVFDYYAGCSDAARRMIFSGLIAIAAGGGLWALWSALTFTRRDAATAADRALGSPRREVLSALELQPAVEPGTASPLADWLRGRMVDRSAEQLRAIPMKRALPVRSLAAAVIGLLVLALIIGSLALLAPAPFQVIARRLLDPSADLPPYSPLQFVLGPQPAEVLYGSEILIACGISGGKIESSVRFLTRDPNSGKIEESPAFQESAGRFSRKMERVASPVEVAFAVGRARSAWLPVRVRMQPKVQEVLVTIDPPTYSRQPRRDFILGAQELAALPGSRVTARVTSNRPLGAGNLHLQAHGGAKGDEEIKGEAEETHRMKFVWIARGTASLSLRVRDVAGTSSEAVQIEQKLLPDERPEVALRQPAGDVLATPETELPLEASANDDLGLARVALVRKLVGYRERSAEEAVRSGERSHEVNGKLDLKAFGVVPGQTIELTVEAGDTNPSLLGVSVSEPVRVHIITRDRYAEMLRSQTTLQEFSDRYAALQEAVDDARKALDELEKAAASGDAKQVEEARQKAFDAHQKAARVFTGIAKDFPIFDLDENLAKASGEVAESLGLNGKDLEELRGKAPAEMAEALPGLRQRLGEMQKRVEPELKKGERAAVAAGVIEQAGKFKELIGEQRDLVRDLDRAQEQIRRGETRPAQALRDLARRQREIEESLKKMERDMESSLKDLPEDFARLREEGEKFLELLRDMEIPPSMAAAAKGAEQADSKAADDQARIALEKMEAVLRNKKNGVCAMCRGEGEGQGEMFPPDLADTMKQLMESLIPKPPGQGGDGQKPGGAASGSQGLSGNSESGFSMKGKMPRLPMYGPPRSRFSKRANSALGGGEGRGQGRGGPEAGAEVAGNAHGMSSQRPQAGEAAAVEAVPEAYREAVKRFFSTEPAGSTGPKNLHP